MKTRTFFLSILILTFSANIFGQKVVKNMLDKNNTPKFIKFENALSYSKANEQTIFNKYLNLSSDDKLVKIKEQTDKLGVKTINYRQYYKNIELEYGQYNLI